MCFVTVLRFHPRVEKLKLRVKQGFRRLAMFARYIYLLEAVIRVQEASIAERQRFTDDGYVGEEKRGNLVVQDQQEPG